MSEPAAVASVPEAATRWLETGRRLAEMSYGVEGIGPLYDRHAGMFDVEIEPRKSLVMETLREKISWQAALTTLAKASASDPASVAALDAEASVLEQLERFDEALSVRRRIAALDPGLQSNQVAIGRLLERAQSWNIASEHYTRVCKTTDDVLLAQCRYLALSKAAEINGASAADLRRGIQDVLKVRPGDSDLHFAAGFLDLAEDDLAAAKRTFVTASIMAEHSEQRRVDPWTLTFAQAFLLDILPPGGKRGAPFAPIDRARLDFLRAAILRLQGAILAALEQYGAALMELVHAPRPRFYSIYKGYRVAAHQRQFYAVPITVTNFSIKNGTVIRHSGVIEQVKPWLAAHIDPRWRRYARTAWHLARRTVRFSRRAVRALRRKLATMAARVYLRLFAAPGVVVDSDVTALRQRIDSLQEDANRSQSQRP